MVRGCTAARSKLGQMDCHLLVLPLLVAFSVIGLGISKFGQAEPSCLGAF